MADSAFFPNSIFRRDSPDAAAVGPVARHAGAGQERRHGLVEQEVVSDQLVLVSLGHGRQRVVLALELSLESAQSLHAHLLDL